MARGGNFRGAPRTRQNRWPYPERAGDGNGDSQMYSGAGSTPIPDPTKLTQAAVRDGVATVREILEAEIDGDLREIKATLDGMAEAVKLIQGWRDKQPGELDARIVQVEKWIGERFATVGQQFETMNERFATVDKEFALGKEYTTQSAIDRKEELKTALSAAEKAVDKNAASFTSATEKSEKATGDLLKQQGEVQRSNKEAIDGTLSDLKIRMATVEATAAAAREAAATANANAQAAAAATLSQQRFERTDQRAASTDQRASSNFVAYVIFGTLGLLITIGLFAIAIIEVTRPVAVSP